jgi:excisionase family DNA binding protein
MQTLTLDQAATLLKLHPQTLLQLARSGNIPAAKPGKCWVFIQQDLIEWLRSKYNRPQQDVGQGGTKKCSLKEKTASIGGIDSPHQTAQQYANLLKLPTKKRHKS